MELDDAVDLGQLHPMLDVEFRGEIVGDIVDIVEETGQELDILLGEPSRVVPGNPHMLLTQHTWRHCDSLRCE